MARSLWSGSLSFGLVNVPVKVVTAIRDHDIRFHQVHEADGGRIHYKRVCSVDGKEVDYDEIAKVPAKGDPVVLTKEEVESVEAQKGETIDIRDFVDMKQIDPLYFDKPYYLVPDKGGDKAYRLLVEAMRKKERAAIASFVFRQKEKLVAIRPLGRALTLTMLNYADEVLLPEEVEDLPKAAKLPKKEVEMAERLIEELATDFDVSRYQDEFKMRLEDLLDAKREGGILLPPPRERPKAAGDLVAALEASLAAARGRKASA